LLAQPFEKAESQPLTAIAAPFCCSTTLASTLVSAGRRKRVKEGAFPGEQKRSTILSPRFSELLPSTVSGLLEAEVLATLSARIGAASELPPLANAEPDERVTRGEGLSAQFMVAARGGRVRGKEEEEKVELWEARLLSSSTL